MKLLLDMNIPFTYSVHFAQRSIKALRWSDVGSPDADDELIMAFAREKDYIVLTYDLDFGTLLSVTHDMKPSVVQIRSSVLNTEQDVDLVVAALYKYRNELLQGAVLSISQRKARIHILPL